MKSVISQNLGTDKLGICLKARLLCVKYLLQKLFSSLDKYKSMYIPTYLVYQQVLYLGIYLTQKALKGVHSSFLLSILQKIQPPFLFRQRLPFYGDAILIPISQLDKDQGSFRLNKRFRPPTCSCSCIYVVVLCSGMLCACLI